jgi:predicted aspartyl protease
MLTRKSKLIATLIIVAAVGARAVSSGAALRVSPQKTQRPRTVSQPQRVEALPRSVSLREVRGRGLLVSVWINSSGPFSFAVDTGAGITIVSPRVAGASAIAIQPGPGPQIAGLSGNVVTAQAGTFQTIALGDPDNRLPAKTNVIISSGLPRDLDGLLDPNDAFGSLGYTIDIPRQELSFFEPRQSPLSPRSQPRDGAVVAWQQKGGNHRPFVTLSTGEQALLDTGSSLGLGVHDFKSVPVYSRSAAVHDVGGIVSAQRSAPRTVSIGALELRNVPTDIITGAASDAPVLLGLNALRPFRLRFDPLHRLIEIAPSNQ